MAQNPRQKTPQFEPLEGLSLRLRDQAEAEMLEKARQSPKTPRSAAATSASPRPGTPSAHRRGAPGPVQGPSTSTQAYAAGFVFPPSRPARRTSTSTPASPSAAGFVVPQSPARRSSTSTQASISAARSVVPPSQQAPGPATSPQVSIHAAGHAVPADESVPVQSPSAEASPSTLPTAPVVTKYDRKTELDTLYQLRSILNDIRAKTVAMQDIIAMLNQQLDVRKVPKGIPKEFRVNAPVDKL